MRLTEISLKRKVAVIVLSLAASVVGVFSLTQLSVDYLPEVTYPMVKVHVYWSGATPAEIETNIAEPVERAMATVDELDYLDSSAIEGMYTLLVNFDYGVNVDIAYQDVLAIMGRVNRALPDDIDPPVIIKADPSQLPVMEVTVASPQRSLVWLREWVDKWLVDRLSSVSGTAGAEVIGGLEREIRVHLDPVRLSAYGLSFDQVAKALQDENRQIFAGRVTVESREIIARTMGEFESLKEIRNTAVARADNGALIYLSDIAQVEDFHEEERVITRFNGRPCVKLNVLKQDQANTVLLSQAIQQKLAELRTQMPPDIELGVFENQGDYVKNAIFSVRDSAVLAAILVILVTYLFLGHWRQVLVMMIALPVTLLISFLLMNLAGFSLNLFSLGGLVVALGVILDNSIIVLENITRLRQHGDQAGEGTSSQSLILAVGEVGPAMVASTLTFIAIFLPFLFIPGLASLLFKELVLVIVAVVLVSLLVAMTLTPFLADRLLQRCGSAEKASLLATSFDAVFNKVTCIYGRLLSYALRGHRLSLALFILIGASVILLLPFVGSEFLPKIDDGRVKVKLKMPAGTAVAETDSILADVEQQLSELPEIDRVFTMAGGRVWGLVTFEIAQEGEVNIQLKPKSQRNISTADFIKKIKPLVKKAMAPGAKMPVMQMKVKGIRQIGEQDVELKVQGADTLTIYSVAQQVAGALNRVEGLSGVNISMDMTKPEYRLYIDRARVAELGISVSKIASVLRGMIGGRVATEYREGNEYYDIRVMVPEPNIQDKEDLENLILDSNNGSPLFVRDIAEVRRAVGPVEINRENQIKQVVVRADKSGISSGEAARLAIEAISQLSHSADVQIVPGGQAQMMEENYRTMGLIFGFALFFAFVTLAVQFDSFRLPIIILLSVPFCFVGVIYALLLTGLSLGVTVAIGVFVIIAATVNDGVLLLSYAENLRKTAGHSPFEAVMKSATIRLRPRMMTTISTIAGLIPLALGLGEGGDLLIPMAVAGIGGLVMEMIVALFLMPVLYLMFFNRGHSRPLPQFC